MGFMKMERATFFFAAFAKLSSHAMLVGGWVSHEKQ
jgi:hypothetical protein